VPVPGGASRGATERARGEPSPSGNGRTRDRNRKERIVAAARELFRERGYHAVGIDDIGEAAGISGPGVYRHFANKEELLVTVLRDATEQLWRALELDGDERPDRLLDAYVRSHVEFAVHNRDVIALWYQERRNLPDDAQIEQRRLQRRYVERWVEVLLHLRPGLDDAEARVMVHAAIGLIHSVVYFESMLDADQVMKTVARMDLAALRA
jgi:AcrR family transcriptional regulator